MCIESFEAVDLTSEQAAQLRAGYTARLGEVSDGVGLAPTWVFHDFFELPEASQGVAHVQWISPGAEVPFTGFELTALGTGCQQNRDALPGEVGPAIILGHIDGSGKRGVFWDLKTLVPGNEIRVTLENEVVVIFTVTRSETVDKDEFPADRVYGFTPKRELRLITCGGAFDRAAGHYTDNTIVYAELAGAPA